MHVLMYSEYHKYLSKLGPVWKDFLCCNWENILLIAVSVSDGDERIVQHKYNLQPVRYKRDDKWEMRGAEKDPVFAK